MSPLLVGLDVTPDPNVVQPGFLPLIITIVLAGICVLLYRSLRKQVGRIKVPYADEVGAAPKQGSAAERTVEPGSGEPRDLDIR